MCSDPLHPLTLSPVHIEIKHLELALAILLYPGLALALILALVFRWLAEGRALGAAPEILFRRLDIKEFGV